MPVLMQSLASILALSTQGSLQVRHHYGEALFTPASVLSVTHSANVIRPSCTYDFARWDLRKLDTVLSGMRSS